MWQITAILACLFLAGSAQERRLSVSARILSNANEDFSKSWYLTLAKNNTGNLFVSPVSTQLAFSMLAVGARGNTKTQLLEALRLPAINKTVLAGFQFLVSSVQGSNKELTLDLANKIYVDNDFSVRDIFQSASKEFFLAEVEKARLREDPRTSRQIINGWVEQHTHGRIKDLLPEGVPDVDTVMALVSAVYFKGNWDQKFDPLKTRKGEFYKSADSVVPVDMMTQTGFYEYDFLKDFSTFVLKMPYQGKEVSMVLIVPGFDNGLTGVESVLSDLDLRTIGNTNEPEKVHLIVPRFKLETSLNLKQSLDKLGVQDVFSRRADLSRLGDGALYVSYAGQKTFLEVNEEGSEAAAATSAGVSTRSMMTLEVNRPFLIIIRHEPTGAILFMGRYTGPD